MAEVTRVEITYYSSVRAEVEIVYRWYVPGNDPWTRVAGRSTSIPSSGDWENRAISGSVSNVRMMTPSEGLVMTLKRFKRITVGSSGKGEFYASGYDIPQFSEFNWRVLSVAL